MSFLFLLFLLFFIYFALLLNASVPIPLSFILSLLFIAFVQGQIRISNGEVFLPDFKAYDMKDSKLVDLLLKLRRANWDRKAKKYLSDTENCRSAKQRQLFEYFYLLKGDFSAEFLEEELIFKEVFPEDELFNQGKLKGLISELVGKIEEFIAIEALKRSPTELKKMLAIGYQALQMDKQQESTLKRAVKKRKVKHGMDYHLHQLESFHDLYYKPQANLHKEKKFGDYLNSALFHNDRLYACYRLKFSTTVLIRKELYGEKPKEGFEKKLQNFLDDFEVGDDAIIKIYAQTAQFFLTPSVERYEQLKADILKCFALVPTEKEVVFTFLVNSLFLVDYPKGRLAEYFNLFQFGVQHKVFVSNGIMSPTIFNNILHIAHQMKAYVWSERFVEEHINYLRYDRQTKENIRILCRCYRFYGEGDYQNVLIHLGMILYDDFTYAIRKYILWFKCIYEMDKHKDLEFFKKKRRSFYSYLEGREHKQFISSENRLRHENFVAILMKIVEFPYKKYSKQSLLDLLESKNGRIVEENWLFEKIKQLHNLR